MERRYWIAAALSLPLVIVGAWFAYGYGTRYCTVMKAANLMREAKDRIAPLDCGEFWLNRYQSLIGAVAAVIAAAVAWIAVSRQSQLQKHANQISEITFWQGKIDAANRALLAITIARANVQRLRQEVEVAPAKGMASISAINRLKETGRLPLPKADVAAMGPLGARYSILATIIENMIREDSSTRNYNAQMDAELAPRMSVEHLRKLEQDLAEAADSAHVDLEFAESIQTGLR